MCLEVRVLLLILKFGMTFVDEIAELPGFNTRHRLCIQALFHDFLEKAISQVWGFVVPTGFDRSGFVPGHFFRNCYDTGLRMRVPKALPCPCHLRGNSGYDRFMAVGACYALVPHRWARAMIRVAPK